MAEFRIQVIVDPSAATPGTRRVRRELGGLENAAESLRRTLLQAFAFTAVAAGIRSLTQLADTFTNVQNRLRTVTDGTEELTVVTQQLFEISNRTRLSFESTAELYARVGLAARELGLSQQQLLQFTESVNQAVVLSGASAQEASAGLIQLSQGLASGALRGDELRSVLEQLPVVADVIADSLGVTRGELRQLGSDGLITAETVTNAFAEAREELTERFGQAVPTVGQSFVVLRNNVIEAIGALDSITGVTTSLSQVILTLSQNLDTAVIAAGALTAILLRGLIASATLAALQALAGPIFAFNIALQTGTASALGLSLALGAVRSAVSFLAANPFVPLVLALGAAAVAVSLVETRTERLNRVNGELDGIVQDISRSYRDAEREAGAFAETASEASLTQALIAQTEAIELSQNAFNALGSQVAGLGAQLLQIGDRGTAGALLDLAQNARDGTVSFAQLRTEVDLIGQTQPALRDFAQRILNAADNAEGLQRSANVAGAAVRVLSGSATDADRSLLGLGQTADRTTASVRNLGTAALSVNSALRTLQGFVPELARAAQASIDLETAQQALTAGQAQLRSRLDAGTISLDNFATASDELNRTYRAATLELTGAAEATRVASDELERYTNDANLSALQGRERALAVEAQRFEEVRAAIVAAGGDQDALTQATAAYETTIAAVNMRFDEMAESSGGASGSIRELTNLLNDASGGVQPLVQRLEQLTLLFQTNQISLEQFRTQLRGASLDILELAVNSGGATFADGFLLQLGRMSEGVTNFRTSSSAVFGNFFESFSTGFANSIGQAIVGTQDLDEALRNVAQQALGQLISSLVQVGIQYVLNAALGQSIAAAATAATAAQAAALAAAWAPAAALASLATGGANAAPAGAAIAATTALSASVAATAGVVPGFQNGGLFNGAGGPRSDSNLVRISDGEFIVNAAATRQNLRTLEAINGGGSPVSAVPRTSAPVQNVATAGQGVSVQIINNAPGVSVREESVTEGQVRLIVEEELAQQGDSMVAQNISNPGSRTSRALSRNTTSTRRTSVNNA